MIKIWEVFWRFLALGCMSFGGPAAHIGYFHRTFVEKLRWIDEESYARLIALSQFLPGPGSSQVGFALGLRRAGLLGGMAAFAGFTLPSFLLLYFLATFSHAEHGFLAGIVSGLKMLAVVVYGPSLSMQFAVLAAAALVGMRVGGAADNNSAKQENVRWMPLVLFALFFVGMPLLSHLSSWAALFASFYQAGSLVFGGGHVVLPLLQQTIGGAVSTDRFLVGYAAAQAIPGPMFSLASFLGAEMAPAQPLYGALLATLGVFLPGFLLVLALQGAWQRLVSQEKVAGAAQGINAAVVGLLLAALYQPVFVSAVRGPVEMACVIAGFFMARTLNVPIVLLVVAYGLLGFFMYSV
jgi:chromate transporter